MGNKRGRLANVKGRVAKIKGRVANQGGVLKRPHNVPIFSETHTTPKPDDAS